MIIWCCWHNGKIGEKEPLEDTRETGGICADCFAKHFPKARTAKELAAEAGTSALLVAMVFVLTACATQAPEPNVYAQCPGKPAHWMSVEQFKAQPSCWLV